MLKKCADIAKFFDISLGNTKVLIILFQSAFILERTVELFWGQERWLWPLALNLLGLLYMVMSTQVNESASQLN